MPDAFVAAVQRAQQTRGAMQLLWMHSVPSVATVEGGLRFHKCVVPPLRSVPSLAMWKVGAGSCKRAHTHTHTRTNIHSHVQY